MTAPSRTASRARWWTTPALLGALGGGVGVVRAGDALRDGWALAQAEAWPAQGLWRLVARELAAPLGTAALHAAVGAAVGVVLALWLRRRSASPARVAPHDPTTPPASPAPPLALRLVAALAAVVVLALGGAALTARALVARTPPADAPHVVFIVIDSLRADSLGCYGYPRDTSPFLDELAASGVRFERALSQESYTLASAASYLTSTYPTTHQVLYDLPRIDTLRPSALSVAEALADAGYSTGAFVFNPHLQARYRFDQGFDVYDDDPRAEGVNEKTPAWKAYETAAFMQRKVDAFLDAAPTDRPHFLYLHYRDVHGPYVPPPEYVDRFVSPDWPERLRKRPLQDAWRPAREAPPNIGWVEYHRSQYDAEIAYTDDALRTLFARLAERGLTRENTLFVVTADHGEEFHDAHPGDTPSRSHGRTLYIEQIHVPLILAWPGRREPVVVREAVELLDLAPTILDAAALPQPESFAGRSLRPLVDGGRRSARPLFSGGSRSRGAVLLEDTIYLEEDLVDRETRRFNARPDDADERAPHAELYDLAGDPRQTTNLADIEHDRVTALRGLLDAWRARRADAPPSAELDVDTLAELRALGYLGDDR